MKPTLSTDLAGIELATPVVAAAGCLRSGKELQGLVDLRKLGGVVTTTVTANPRAGSPTPRVVETPSGILYSIGMQNPGVDAFVKGELQELLKIGIPVIVSVGGSSVEEFVRVSTAVAHASGVVGLELNLACFDEERGGTFAYRADRAGEVTGAVSRLTRLPVFSKLTADSHDIVDIAGSCVHAGANGLTLVSGPLGMSMGLMSMQPQLGGEVGRLSGPAIRPLAIRAVYEVSRALPEVPIMGVGGVMEATHAIEMMLAGATVVQIGTGMLVDPSAPIDIARGVLKYLRAADLPEPSAIRHRSVG